ncbi:hypothetical protein M9H77_35496 [Catharanthus roseus]|uniref:Uncharacterized protein n=1 Tax=Catharanthus roseus TaxID=4058 RepID=A0ACB9ZP65_CATRO|nr:hypothetical protein M9H77_35496 [Catharanthus roseus]
MASSSGPHAGSSGPFASFGPSTAAPSLFGDFASGPTVSYLPRGQDSCSPPPSGPASLSHPQGLAISYSLDRYIKTQFEIDVDRIEVIRKAIESSLSCRKLIRKFIEPLDIYIY